jgi:hypothetical protein
VSTIERLKVLYEERYMELQDIAEWNDAIEKEWPKLLAFVEAFDMWNAAREGPYLAIHAWYELGAARMALEEIAE